MELTTKEQNQRLANECFDEAINRALELGHVSRKADMIAAIDEYISLMKSRGVDVQRVN